MCLSASYRLFPFHLVFTGRTIIRGAFVLFYSYILGSGHFQNLAEITGDLHAERLGRLFESGDLKLDKFIACLLYFQFSRIDYRPPGNMASSDDKMRI